MFDHNLILNPNEDVFRPDDKNAIRHRMRMNNDLKVAAKRLRDAIENHYLIKDIPQHFFDKRKIRKSPISLWQMERKQRGVLPTRDQRKCEEFQT